MAMKRTMKVVFSLALLLLPLASAVEAKFDFMYLVQQWPDSYCSTHKYCIVKPPSHFTIHGLWPSYNKRPGPHYCKNYEAYLDPKHIENLETLLNKKWPSLTLNQNNLEFWSHEWRRHGTCSKLGQHRYFKAALKLAKLHSLSKIIAGAGIVPSNQNTYTFREISDALAWGTGLTTYFKCSKNKAGDTLLSEVFQCVDRYGEKLINCTAPFKKKAHSCVNVNKIKLPTWFHH